MLSIVLEVANEADIVFVIIREVVVIGETETE